MLLLTSRFLLFRGKTAIIPSWKLRYIPFNLTTLRYKSGTEKRPPTTSGAPIVLQEYISKITNAKAQEEQNKEAVNCSPTAPNNESGLMSEDYSSPMLVRPALSKKDEPKEHWSLYAAAKDTTPKGPGVKQSGGGIGKLDSANEDGYFFKVNQSRLKKLKELLKGKDALKSKEPNPENKT